MENMIEMLRNIGLPDSEIQRVVEYYRDDFDGFRQYYLYIRMMFDDRNEYI